MPINHETIAAFIAARAPEPRYGSPFSMAFLASERELGERIGYPALVYQKTTKRTDRYYFEPSRDGGSDIMDEDRPIRDTDIVDRLNEQDDDLSRLRGELATAHEALGQSAAAMELAWELADCYRVIGADGDASDVLQARRRSEEILTQFDLSIVSARAFLRRA